MVMGVREIREQFNPANTSECIGKIELHTIEETEVKIRASEQAFQQWSKLSSVSRGEILNSMANLLIEHLEPLAELASKEMGKTVPEMMGEVKRGLRFYVISHRKVCVLLVRYYHLLLKIKCFIRSAFL